MHVQLPFARLRLCINKCIYVTPSQPTSVSSTGRHKAQTFFCITLLGRLRRKITPHAMLHYPARSASEIPKTSAVCLEIINFLPVRAVFARAEPTHDIIHDYHTCQDISAIYLLGHGALLLRIVQP